MPGISFITTCKGRLAHLKETLPLLAAQGGEHEVIVVDYDCPQGAAAWVAENFPTVRVVRESNAPEFKAGRARNLGAAVARQPWLMFVDADVRLPPAFGNYIQPALAPGRYLRAAPTQADTYGTCLVAKQDFERQGGYDEVLRGWSSEDDDLYSRLERYGGCTLATFPGALLTALVHDDALRMQFRGSDGKWLGHQINGFYLHIKYDLMRLLAAPRLDMPLRVSLYEEVRRAVLAVAPQEAERASVTVAVPGDDAVRIIGGKVRRRWVYELEFQRDRES
ncbi:MAG: glycosyltransferase [Rhodocyclaceae bacterium]|nr:MAG: glycosyltransferase [Rhodocyclaceae bacterium]